MLQSLPIDAADAHVWEFYAVAAFAEANDLPLAQVIGAIIAIERDWSSQQVPLDAQSSAYLA